MGARRVNVGREVEGSPRRREGQGLGLGSLRFIVAAPAVRHPRPPCLFLVAQQGDAGLAALRSVPRAFALCPSR